MPRCRITLYRILHYAIFASPFLYFYIAFVLAIRYRAIFVIRAVCHREIKIAYLTFDSLATAIRSHSYVVTSLYERGSGTSSSETIKSED
jgi:fatty-acid desaturase